MLKMPERLRVPSRSRRLQEAIESLGLLQALVQALGKTRINWFQ